jgi:hypothetical protein
MHIVRVGGRYYNLEYLIVAGPADGPDGGTHTLVVTMESGKEYLLIGPEADEFSGHLARALAPGSSGPGASGQDFDPATGAPLPRRPPDRERKTGG